MTYIEAIAQVDHGYFLLGKINEKLSIKKQPIERTIDKACGYDETKELRELGNRFFSYFRAGINQREEKKIVGERVGTIFAKIAGYITYSHFI